jgi:hypothetical protein
MSEVLAFQALICHINGWKIGLEGGSFILHGITAGDRVFRITFISEIFLPTNRFNPGAMAFLR